MKNLVFFAAAMLLALSCSNESTEEVNNPQAQLDVQPVRVHVNTFSYSMEDMAPTRSLTRATQTVLAYEAVGAIDLAFFRSDGTQVYNQTQYRSTAGDAFGTITCSLPVGSYTMVVVARGYKDGDAFAITSPTAAGYTSDKVRETFCKSQNVVVNNTAGVDVGVTLERVVARLLVSSTDNKIADVAAMRATYAAGSKSFNPATGLAASNEGFVVTTSAGTEANISMYSYVFLTQNTQNIDITIEALDADNAALFTKQLAAVPFQRNRLTMVSGNMFSNAPDAQFSFSLETSWVEMAVVEF